MDCLATHFTFYNSHQDSKVIEWKRWTLDCMPVWQCSKWVIQKHDRMSLNSPGWFELGWDCSALKYNRSIPITSIKAHHILSLSASHRRCSTPVTRDIQRILKRVNFFASLSSNTVPHRSSYVPRSSLCSSTQPTQLRPCRKGGGGGGGEGGVEEKRCLQNLMLKRRRQSQNLMQKGTPKHLHYPLPH